MHVPKHVQQLLSSLGAGVLFEDRKALRWAPQILLSCSLAWVHGTTAWTIMVAWWAWATHACSLVGGDCFSGELGAGIEATSAERVSESSCWPGAGVRASLRVQCHDGGIGALRHWGIGALLQRTVSSLPHDPFGALHPLAQRNLPLGIRKQSAV